MKISGKDKLYISVIAVVLILAMTVCGTVAYLTDKDSVKNTFTIGNIEISLDESDDLDLKMVPGTEIFKDPIVTVEAGSEACWLFVKVDESNNLEDFITYEIADGWTAGSGESGNGVPVGVYFREQEAISKDGQNAVYPILKDNKVHVKPCVTKEMLDALTDETRPTLTFTAYAIQKPKFDTAKDAWIEVIKE